MAFKKKFAPRRKFCRFCADKDLPLNYKRPDILRDFITERGKIIARRANQIATELKTELNRKLADFSSPTDTMEETFENREQIEISRYYERLPKPVIIATEEFLDHELVYKEGKDGVMKEI